LRAFADSFPGTGQAFDARRLITQIDLRAEEQANYQKRAAERWAAVNKKDQEAIEHFVKAFGNSKQGREAEAVLMALDDAKNKELIIGDLNRNMIKKKSQIENYRNPKIFGMIAFISLYFLGIFGFLPLAMNWYVSGLLFPLAILIGIFFPVVAFLVYISKMEKTKAHKEFLSVQTELAALKAQLRRLRGS
jgi:hypothetical protein